MKSFSEDTDLNLSKGTRYLTTADPIFKKLFLIVGDITLQLEKEYYESLIKKIIGQQLSIKAADSIFQRVKLVCKEVTPININTITDIELKKCGVSKPKISFIRDLTQKILENKLTLKDLDTESDENVISILTNVKGIGRWTAEMFIIFSLGRLNVFSSQDVSLKRAVEWLYQNKVDKEELIELWSPYNTIASLYLWEIINRNYINKFEDIDQLYLNSVKGG